VIRLARAIGLASPMAGWAQPGPGGPQMQRPPSTSMHTPVIMLASSLHR